MSSARRDVPRLSGVLVLAAAWIYFLLFAQYAFVRQLADFGLGQNAVDQAMGALGLGGILGSLLAARRAAVGVSRRDLSLAFLGAALAALATPGVDALGVRLAVGAVAGLSTGFATVSLAARLPQWIGARTGLGVGLATGVAYWFCNVPPLFAGPPGRQALVSACVAFAGAALCFVPTEGRGREEARSLRFLPTAKFAGLVLAFAALVGVDATAFAVIQRIPRLYDVSWGGDARQWLQGGVHLLAAIGCGFVLDRGPLRRVLLSVAALFTVAFFLLENGSALGGPLYAVGISAYSVALVVAPTLGASGRQAARRAAVLFVLAGWIASGLGVGLAQRLDHLGFGLILGVGMAVAAGLGVSLEGLRVRLSGTGVQTLLVALVGALVVLLVPPDEPSATEGEAVTVARGRAVYIAEGCLHCHSQAVRPAGLDEDVWGPSRPLDRSHGAPLVGNRRQGPDLMNVGCRRSARWQEIHLKDPGSLVPGTRMPAFPHLFEDGRGEDLVAYLGSLGREALGDCQETRASWAPAVEPSSGDPGRGHLAWDRHCAMCHGASGQGDGPLASSFRDETVANLTDENWRWVPQTSDETDLELARIVRFGIPGTSMPGHEMLEDVEVADLVAWVRTLAPKDVRAARPTDDGRVVG